ncbi:MAG: hypothetical protein ABIQ40_04130 [Bacteroidia bacterium]
MADFYFFADYDLLQTQGYGDEFNHGSSTSKGYSVHKLSASAQLHPQTSTFFNGPSSQFDPLGTNEIKAQKISPAYAICDGRIFVIRETPSNTPGLVYTSLADIQQTATIILQPSSQPSMGLPKIKYFIYKRVLLGSLVGTTGEIIPDGRDGNFVSAYYTNLTSQILDAVPNNGSAFSNALDNDYGLNPDNATLLDEIFHKDDPNFQTFQVCGGDSIGYFPQAPTSLDTSIRIGIVFDDVDYHISAGNLGVDGGPGTLFDFALNTHHFNTFNGNTIQNSSVLNSYITDCQRDRHLHFLDPCAFYGSFAYNTLDRLYARQFADDFTVIPRASVLPQRGRPVYTRQSPDDLYNNILSKFYNKNMIYVDIRSPETKQMNFFDNYDDNVLLKILDPTTASPKNAYNVLSPIKATDNVTTPRNTEYIALDPSFFATGSAPMNRFDIALPDGKSHNFTYQSQTYTAINNEFPSAYVDSTYLRGSPIDGGFPASSFVEVTRDVLNTDFSSSIPLQVRNFNNDLQQPICTYIRIYYIKEQDTYIMPRPTGCSVCDETIAFPVPALGPEPFVDRTLRSYEYLDNFFTPFAMVLPQAVPPPTPPNGIASNIYYDPKFLDNTRVGGQCMMAYPGIAQDSSGRITLFATAADPRTPPKSMVESGINASGMVANGNLNTFLNFLSTNYPGVQYEGFMLAAADIGEPGNRFAERITGLKNDTRPESLAWLTIEQNDYDRLQKINNSRTGTGNSYLDPNSPTPFTADFIVPSRTFLGTRIVSTGETTDVNSLVPVDFIKYEFILRNETYDSLGRIVFKSIPTGVYSFSVRVLGRDITDALKAPRLVSDSIGIFIDETVANSEYRMRSTVFLLPDANIRPDELYEFQQHVLCSIRQIWTNRNDLNSETGNAYNCGKYNSGLHYSPAIGNPPAILIDAEQVNVVIGTGRNAGALAPGAVAFRVAKPGVAQQLKRAFIAFPAQTGTLFYNPVSPLGSANRNRYVDNDPAQDNTAAHEFGHHMGLADRYTSSGVVNRSDYSTIGIYEGNKPMYMQDYGTGLSFDTDFIMNYNWGNNLYTTSETVYGDTINPTPASMTPMIIGLNDKIGPELAYRNNIQDVFVPTTPNTQTPPRYNQICVFITPVQWAAALAYIRPPALTGRRTEAQLSAADPYPTYFVSDYVFFKDYSLIFPPFPVAPSLGVTVSELGFKYASPPPPGTVPLHTPVSDLRYNEQPGGALTVDGVEELRIRKQPPASPTYLSTIDNAIAGYFSPYTDIGFGALARTEIETDPIKLADVTNSGLGLIQTIDDDLTIADKVAAIRVAIPGWPGTNTIIDLRVLDPYSTIGDGDPVGRRIWNFQGTPRTTTVGIFTVLYYERPARTLIVQRIQGTN